MHLNVIIGGFGHPLIHRVHRICSDRPWDHGCAKTWRSGECTMLLKHLWNHVIRAWTALAVSGRGTFHRSSEYGRQGASSVRQRLCRDQQRKGQYRNINEQLIIWNDVKGSAALHAGDYKKWPAALLYVRAKQEQCIKMELEKWQVASKV